MTLMYVFSQYPAETFAVTEVEALRAQGLDVRPVALRWSRRRLRHAAEAFGLDADTVTVLPLTDARVWMGFVRFLVARPVWLLRELGLVLRENWSAPRHLLKSIVVAVKAPAVANLADRLAADAVHVFWGHYPSVVVPFLKAKTPGRPVSVFVGAYSLVDHVPSQGRVLQEADCLTTHFEGHVGTIRERWPNNRKPVATIYRGVDLERLRRLRDAGGAAANRGARVGVVSRLARDKCVDHALRAFALLARHRPSLTLEVIGTGPEERALKRLAADLGIDDEVAFAGQLPYPATLEGMCRFAVLVIPSMSDYEFYPNVLKEAIGLGVPCAAYAVPGIARFAVTGSEVRLARAGRVEELARAMADLLDDARLRAATLAAGSARVQAFDVAVTARKQAALFSALVGRAVLPGSEYRGAGSGGIQHDRVGHRRGIGAVGPR